MASGVACYKAIDLMRDLQRAGAEIRVVLTEGAANLVGSSLFEALGATAVSDSMWDRAGGEPVETGYARFPHLDFARGIDAIVIAPATANTLGKLAHGIGDDLLSTVLLAVDPHLTPVVIAPTMNASMYEHPAVRANRDILRNRGYWLVAPGEGELACGETGTGRWPGNETILAALDRAVNGSRRLEGEHVIVTAGRTEAALDPARMLTNRATGRMGFAVARSAWRHGARVTLIHGPTELTPPPFMDVIAVRTGAEMSDAVFAALPGASQLWMVAAVTDWEPSQPSEHKIAKDSWDGRLDLMRTEDILSRAVIERDEHTMVVGFAVETDDPETRAREKLERKGCDFIVLNNPLERGAGFGSETNRVTMFDRFGGRAVIEFGSKDRVAEALMQAVLARGTSQPLPTR